MTLYEVLEEEVKLGRSCPQDVPLSLLVLTGADFFPSNISELLLFHLRTLLFLLLLSKCEILGVPQEGAVWGCIHCCWEHVFGPSCPIILKHQKPWKSSCPSTQQSHFKRSKRDRGFIQNFVYKDFPHGIIYTVKHRNHANINKRKLMTSIMRYAPN